MSSHFSPPRNYVSHAGRQNNVVFAQQVCSSSQAHQNFSPFVVPSSNPNIKLASLSKNLQKLIATEVTPQLKAPKAPEKPLTPYMRYYRTVCDKVRSTHPDSKLWDVGKVVGAMWRELADELKQPYFDDYDLDKAEYERAMKAYKLSPAYLAYDQQLQKQKMMTTKVDKQATVGKTDLNSASSGIGVYIQPVDEDDGDDVLPTVCHAASIRFQRNQRLLMEIFNNVAVPDTRSVVNVNRLAQARRQFRSLASHQKNAEAELEQIENNFKAKKRMMETLSTNFANKIQKVDEKIKQISDENFEQLVKKHEINMMDAYATHKLKQLAVSQHTDPISRDVASLLNDVIDQVKRNLDSLTDQKTVDVL